MEIFRDETEFTDIHMVQRVVDLFENRSGFQRIVRLGLIANMNYDNDSDEDGYRADSWAHDRNHIRGYPGLSDSRDRGLGGNHTRPHSVCVPPMHYYTSSCEVPSPSSVKVTTKESDSERKARLLEEEKKSKEKAERKRLKKQNRKERKRLEKLEKEKQNPKRYTEEKDDAQQSKAEESKPANDESKNNTGVSVKQLASAKDIDSSDSSEDESSDEDSVTKNDLGDCEEELDMTSTFVSKAALIAKRKLEKKPKPEKREKKKTPVKEEPKTVPDKLNEVPEVEKQASAASVTHSHEENIKISTDLAVIGNKFASAGDFNMAVKYFTDAIKYNPTEFKLFGNRSFCFEKMQEYEKALTDAELSLSMWPGWVKGLFRKGRALAGLKRYEEAARAFKEVLKLDTSCAEAAQELMRVQITQLMEYGFTREQSSNALIIHGTVEKALEVLTKLNHRPGAFPNGPLQPAQVVNVSGVSPVLSANTVPAPHPPPQSMNAPKTAFKNKPLGPVHNMSNVQSQPKPVSNQAMKTNSEDSHPPHRELFPVWVGNLTHPVTESMITNVFNKVGVVYSVKLLIYRRCAFVNFTKQEHCDEAIRRLHGYELNGMKIAVRYPDRIPPGMGISRSALKAEDLQDENMRQNDYAGGRRPVHPHRHVPDFRGNHKY